MAGATHSDDLDAMRQEALNAADRISMEELRKSGRQTARERISMLLDADSFVEVDSFVQHRSGDFNMHLHRPYGDGVVAGHGKIDGRRVVCFAQDYAVFDGTMGEMHARKSPRLQSSQKSRNSPYLESGMVTVSECKMECPLWEQLENCSTSSSPAPVVSLLSQ